MVAADTQAAVAAVAVNHFPYFFTRSSLMTPCQFMPKAKS
jgi:hypothetical protein